jgi:hypothetical protein
VTYKETIRVTEDWFGDQHLVASYRNPLRTRTQLIGEPLWEFATAIEQLTHHAFPALHEDHIYRGAGKAFSNGIRDQGIKRHLLLGGKKTLNEALR